MTVLCVVALDCEARPIIDHWRLQRDRHQRAFPVYRSEARDCGLIVSGVGAMNAATATAHLLAITGDRPAVCLNIGITGHANRAIGSAIIAHTVYDQVRDHSYYPPLLFSPCCESDALHTVGVVGDYYPDNAALDMEASGFFSAALRYTNAELVHALKVIADNSAQSRRAINKQNTQARIAANIGVIEHTVACLSELAADTVELPIGVPEAWQTLRFSFSQQQQLMDLLRRWYTLSDNKALPLDKFANCGSGKQLLARFHEYIDQWPVSYGT